MRQDTSTRPDVDTTTPAVVLKLDANVFHHGGLGVIRSLGRLGIPVYAVHEESFTPAASSRYLRGGWLWHPDLDDAERLRAGLIQLAGRIGRPAVLIPTDDAGALFLAEHGEDLHRWFLFPRQRPGLPRQVADKTALSQLCERLGVPSPATTVAHSPAEVADFVARVGLPIVVKVAQPWDSALRSTTVVRTRADLDDLYRVGGRRMMLQEYLPDGQDWVFHGYADTDSECHPAFTGRKHRSYPAHAGLTSMGRAVPNPRLVTEIRDLLHRLGYRGILDLDLRWDPRDDQYKLLDFNPRLGAQFRLFHDTAAVDVAVAAHLDLTGRPVPHAEMVARGFLVENYDPIAALAYWRSHELKAGAWWRSLRDVDELAWFARDDLAPFGLMCLRMAWRAMERPFGRRMHRPATTEPRYRPGRGALQTV